MKGQSHRKKIRLDIRFILLKSIITKNPELEGRFQKKIQKAIRGIESTVKTDTG